MLKQLDKIGKFLYLGTVVPLYLSLLTPLLVNSNFLFPFITTKTLFFRILVEIALVFFILLIIKESDLRPRLTKINWLVAIFAGVVTLTAFFGVDLYRSFWGNIERGEGLLTLFHVVVFFFIVSQIWRTKRQWFWFLDATVLVSLFSSIYALAQLLGWNRILFFSVINTTGERLAATVGNAAFYAGFLLFGIFLAAWLFVQKKSWPWRACYIVVILFESYILLQTETRGAFFGFSAALVLIPLLYALYSRGRRRVVAGVLLGIVVLTGLLIYWQKDGNLVQRIAILRRVTSISLTDITSESRLLTWDSSWQAFKDRPLSGYGWENYNVAFNKYFHAEIFRDAGSQIWFDRSHNIIFDLLVTTGLLGFLAYFCVLFWAIVVLIRVFRRTKDLASLAILGSLIVAYIIQNLFVFDVLATFMSFYLLLGLISFLESQISESKRTSTETSGQRIRSKFYNPLTVVVLTLFLVLAFYSFNQRPAKANLKGVQALILSAQGEKFAAGQELIEAIELNTYQSPELRQKLAELAIEANRSTDLSDSEKQFLFNEAIEKIKDNIREHPNDIQHYLFLMILYNQSDQYDPIRLTKLLQVGEKALVLSPTRPQIYFELGQAYLSRQDFDQGVAAFEKAVALQPKALESRWNLAVALELASRSQKAQAEFDYLQQQGFDYYSMVNLQRMILVYRSSKNWVKLAEVYQYLLQMDPANLEYYTQLAGVYQQLGEFDKARQTALQAVAIEPGFAAQAQEFIEHLGVSQENIDQVDQQQTLTR